MIIDHIIWKKSLNLSENKYERSFNGSILPFENGYLFAYRNTNTLWFESDIWLTYLDSEFNIIKESKILDGFANEHKYADPRLFKIKQDYYIIFFDQDMTFRSRKCFNEPKKYWMSVSKIDTDHLSLNSIKKLHELNDTRFPSNKMEKNWQPFIIDSQIKFIHSIMDCHIILNFDHDFNFINYSKINHSLKYNCYLSCSVVPVEMDNLYYGIYHYFKMIKNHRVYFSHFYAFDSNGNIKYYSKDPNIIGDIPKIEGEKPYGIDGVLFPCSIIKYHNNLLLSFGYQDKDCYLCEIDFFEILKKMIKV